MTDIPTFSLVAAIRPLSLQAERQTAYRSRLRAEAVEAHGTRGFLQGDLYARIIWFHRDKTTRDVDNITKAILDTLKGVVFGDDHPGRKCVTERVDQGRNYEVTEPRIADWAYERLLGFLERDIADILYVEVGPVVGQRVIFGPIDGGSE
jgi:hypothetical protein